VNLKRLAIGIYKGYEAGWSQIVGNNPSVLFVIASGNDGTTPGLKDAGDNDIWPVVPANLSSKFPNLLTVTATDNEGRLVDFANHSETLVQLGAPGYNIEATVPGDLSFVMSGTSMASPAVAGAAAGLFQAFPKTTAPEMRAALESSVTPKESLKGKSSSGGVMNAQAAYEVLAGRGTAAGALGAISSWMNDLGRTNGLFPGGLFGEDFVSVDLDVTHQGELRQTDDFERSVVVY
jgi:subtilisin family serine protease